MDLKQTTIVALITLIAGPFVLEGCHNGECDDGDKKCENGVVHVCSDDGVPELGTYWEERRDCDARGAVCREYGKDRAACVVPDERCPKKASSGCLGKNIHECAGPYLENQPEESCDQFCMLSESEITGDRSGTCTVSETPCPPDALSFCQDGQVHVCGYDGFPVERWACGNNGQRCVEGEDAFGWRTAACALDTDCKESELSRCVGRKIYDCVQFHKPVFLQDCEYLGQDCVALDDRLDAFCRDDVDWIPYGDRPVEWIAISGDTFDYGDSETRWFNNSIEVTVDDFEMLKTEVTVAQYRSCVAKGVCRPPKPDHSDFYGEYNDPALDPIPRGLCNWDMKREDHPINCISWQQAHDFCSWAGGRLPSETEWEFAARSRGMPFDSIPEADCTSVVMTDRKEIPGCGKKTTWPVCSREAGNTVEGLCDMRGNVTELVQDHWHEYLGPGTGQPTDGSAWEDPDRDSTENGSDSEKAIRSGYVRRSGHYNSDSLWVAIGVRWDDYFTEGETTLGFRCAR